MLYLTHARLPIDPFLVPSGGRTAAAVAALERSFGQQDEDMSSSLRRLNLSSTQDYSAMSPSPSFDTSSVGGSSSRTGTPGGTPSRPPVSNSYWDQHITSIRSLTYKQYRVHLYDQLTPPYMYITWLLS